MDVVINIATQRRRRRQKFSRVPEDGADVCEFLPVHHQRRRQEERKRLSLSFFEMQKVFNSFMHKRRQGYLRALNPVRISLSDFRTVLEALECVTKEIGAETWFYRQLGTVQYLNDELHGAVKSLSLLPDSYTREAGDIFLRVESQLEDLQKIMLSWVPPEQIVPAYHR